MIRLGFLSILYCAYMMERGNLGMLSLPVLGKASVFRIQVVALRAFGLRVQRSCLLYSQE